MFSIDLGGVSIPIEIDSRDHEQFPRNGWHVVGQTVIYRESVGSDFEAETYKLSVNHYFPMRDADVLATRLVMKSADEDVPFFLLSTFGGKTDLRGYPSGRYRDETMYALQTEYRWQFSDRWVFTGFAGVGEVAHDVNDFQWDLIRYSYGVGLRFIFDQGQHVNLRADIGIQPDGTGVYFGMQEAF